MSISCRLGVMLYPYHEPSRQIGTQQLSTTYWPLACDTLQWTLVCGPLVSWCCVPPPLFLSKSHTEEAGMEGAVPSFLMTSLSTSPMTISRFSSVLSIFPLLTTLQIQNKRAISSITKSKQKIQTKMALLYGKLLTIMCSTCAVC